MDDNPKVVTVPVNAPTQSLDLHQRLKRLKRLKWLQQQTQPASETNEPVIDSPLYSSTKKRKYDSVECPTKFQTDIQSYNGFPRKLMHMKTHERGRGKKFVKGLYDNALESADNPLLPLPITTFQANKKLYVQIDMDELFSPRHLERLGRITNSTSKNSLCRQLNLYGFKCKHYDVGGFTHSARKGVKRNNVCIFESPGGCKTLNDLLYIHRTKKSA